LSVQIIEEIMNRRSIREYSQKPVEREKLARILEAGRLAPTARNQQDWRILIVTDSQLKNRLIDEASPGQAFLKQAPVILVACALNPEYVMRCGHSAFLIDLAIVLEHVALQAVREGLGTCWIGSFDEAKAKSVLNVPEMGNMVNQESFSSLKANVAALHDPMFPLYVIRGGQNLLVDCGILAKAGEIEKRLDALLGNEKIHMVLLTHSHYDHTGACSVLQDKYGFEIVSSQRTKEILEDDKAVAFIDDLNQKFKNILNDRSNSVFKKPRDIRSIGESDAIRLPSGQEIEIFTTPGHTRCSISFFLKPENILFPGDAAGILEKNGKIKPLFLSSYTQYERSLKKLLAIKADVLALPHNSAVEGEKRVGEFLAESLAEAQWLKDHIAGWLDKTNDFSLIAEKLLEQEYFSPTIMGPREALLINVTAMVKSVFYEVVKKP
jgi:glyoxylase-like metal-dependent hydrolase (beta-lactamase superfamily II)